MDEDYEMMAGTTGDFEIKEEISDSFKVRIKYYPDDFEIKEENTDNDSITMDNTDNRSITKDYTDNRSLTKDNSDKRSITKDNTEKRRITKDNTDKRSITKDNTKKRSITKDNTKKRSITKDNTEKRSITKDNTAKRSITKDNTAKRSITKDNTEKRSITKDNTDKSRITEDNTDNHSIIKDNTDNRSITKYNTDNRSITKDNTDERSITKDNTDNQSITKDNTDERSITKDNKNKRSITKDNTDNQSITKDNKKKRSITKDNTDNRRKRKSQAKGKEIQSMKKKKMTEVCAVEDSMNERERAIVHGNNRQEDTDDEVEVMDEEIEDLVMKCKLLEDENIRLLHTLPVVATPGGSMHIEAAPAGSRVRHIQSKPAVPLSVDALERVEALDMSEEEAEEIMEEARVDEGETSKSPAVLRASVTSSVAEDNSPVDVRPSTSRLTSSARAPRAEYGSDLDSDYDEEFDEPDQLENRQNLPEMEELAEPMQEIVREIDTGMDNEADCLLGTSASFTWVSDFESFKGVREEFTGPTPGPLKDYDSPYDVFTDIWDKDIIELIVRETNRYAQQTLETGRRKGTLKPSSRLHSWTDTNADEIMVLFGMFMYMAIDPRTSVAEYWTLDKNLEMPGFRSLMSYNRYVLLSKFLHFVDNEAVSQQLPQTGDSYSPNISAKLGKLAPIMVHLEKKFKSLYNLGPNLSIDESLTLFKGRLSWVQAIRSKAARFGIKSYELCESHTGYMAGFQIYTGKVEDSGGDSSLGVNLGRKSTQVVLQLLQGLEHRGHCVVMDNFYNCPSLARYLKSLGFDCYGTLRVCRQNVPSDIANVSKQVSKGTIISRHCEDVSIIAWMDSKMVNIISTYHRPDTYKGTRAGKGMVKPVCVRDYNKCMGGVDLKDQKLSMYLLERKRGVKWYIKMFKRLLNVSIHNALVMYVSSLKRRDKLPVTHRDFRHKLAEALTGRHGACPVQISRPVGDVIRLRRDIVHEPAYLSGSKNRKRCVMCCRVKKNKMVHSMCIQCDVYLCFVDCWKIWHSKAELPGKDLRARQQKYT